MKYLNSHLAYCTNVHPAESWLETWETLRTHTLEVRDAVSPDKPFAIGLRLSARAAREVLAGDKLGQFQNWLSDENCYVFTINGFPYGDFHNTRVKEQVYRPDWSTAERLSYTFDLFEIIAELAPEESGGSVSTLPGSFKDFDADEFEMFQNLEAAALRLEELSLKTGKDLHLGMEPEPFGHFENTEETLAFFGRFWKWSERVDLLKRRIGINYDTCHFALQFEDCTNSLAQLTESGLRISKLHLSNALSVDPESVAVRTQLEEFVEPTYLHQVLVAKDGDVTERFTDLPQALEKADISADEWRIHFHIPLYENPKRPFGSTRDHAAEALKQLRANTSLCPHLEIETYTWGVLPKELQCPVTEMIEREYRWVLAQCQ